MVEEVIVKSKEVFYRGKSVDELKKLGVRESAQYLPSRSRRSVLRHFDVVERFIKRCEATTLAKKKIRTHLRDMVIVPQFVGYNIFVYTGKEFKEVKITHHMI